MIPSAPLPASSASLVQSTSQLFLGGFPDAVGESGFVGADDLIVGLSGGFAGVPADEFAEFVRWLCRRHKLRDVDSEGATARTSIWSPAT
jgi:hypothetical protein